MMNGSRLLCNGVESIRLPDSRFKTAQITVGLFLPLAEATVEEYALLPSLLTRACAAYPDFTALNRRLNELYGAVVSGRVTRVGESQCLVLTAECTDDRFALNGEAVTAECAELLCNMLFSPALENGVFRTADVETERRCLAEEVRAQINEKRVFARTRAEQLLCPNEAYGIGRCGKAEIIEQLTPAQMTAAWQRMLRCATVRLIVQGGNAEQIEEAFKKGFDAVRDRAPLPCITDTTTHLKEQARLVERMAVKQAKLVLGFRTDCAEPNEDVSAVRLMNAVLGGTPASFLFRNVREKLSLCYYCSSAYDRMKGILLVQSGVEEANAARAESEIIKQVAMLANGEFTDDDLEAARRAVIQSFEAVTDSQAGMAGWYLSQTLLPRMKTPAELRAEIQAVSRDAVIRAAARLRCECVYLLAQEGENDG